MAIRNAQACFLAAVVILAAANERANAAIIYNAGFQSPGPNPQTYFAEDPSFSDTNAASGKQLSASAGVIGLQAKVGLKGGFVENFMSSIRVDDLIFTSNDPNKTTTIVTFTARFKGTAPGSPPFNYSPNAQLSLNNIQGPTVVLGSPGLSINEILSVTAEVGLNSPVSASAQMEMRLAAPIFQIGFLVFDDSLDFFPNEVFVLEPGVTVNSASWGLVNNQLPVPEPSSLFVFAVLASVLLRYSGERQRQFSCL